MKRLAKWVGAAVGVIVLAVAGFLIKVQLVGIPTYAPGHVELTVEVTPERVVRGRKFASLLCAGCHMNPTTRQLTGKQMLDLPPAFGTIITRNITKDKEHGIGAWTDGELAYLLRTGIARDGHYVPIYMPKLPLLSDDDLASIIAFLRSDDPLVQAAAVDPPGTSRPGFLVKLLASTVWRPLPYPKEPIAAPPAGDQVALGRYLVAGLQCYACHSADFKQVDQFQPERSVGYLGGGNQLVDLRGQTIVSTNLTPDEETGIGRWNEGQFVHALRKGFRPDHSLIRYPMEPLGELSDEEAGAIYAYLRTVPKLRNRVVRQIDAVASGELGKQIYYKYGCVSCHGDDGVGTADLRQCTKHYPGDEQLKAWIANAPGMKPDTKMPSWQGIIAESEYPPLMAYVRTLAK